MYGQIHTYTVYIQCFWQGSHQIYGQIRCIYKIYGSGQPYLSLKLCLLLLWAFFFKDVAALYVSD